MATTRTLRPVMPILFGAAIMLSLSMGIRQCFGLFMQPLTKDLAITVSNYTLALSNRSPAHSSSASVIGPCY